MLWNIWNSDKNEIVILLFSNEVTGKCICPPGLTGEYCENRCPHGRYGPECGLVCECGNNSTCDPTSGCCDCSPGYYGRHCDLGT